MLARAGGEVTALDFSRNAVASLNEYARANGVGNLTAVCGDALRIDGLGKFDFVFGSLILHHIEPFADFCTVLRQTLRPGGRAFFFENNAASDLLVWFREHVVGKLWVPRHGDGVEFPLTPGEVALLRRQFRVDIRIPEMVFFQLVSTYLLRRRLHRLMKSVDDLMFRHDVGKRYSYRQYVMIHG
jgi:2-polyprenyl-3-methyl-5-hydroxy-6-metoxy-1,4-benzoquinol methylase